MLESLLNLKWLKLDNIYQFLNFALPIIISIWGIFFIRKSKFYFIETSCIKLYQDIVRTIDGISIQYKEDEIRENLILFSGSIIYNGHNDIKADEIDREITIYSADQTAKWLHFEIKNSSEFFNPSFRIEENKVIINRSLWKNNDFINFAGLVDTKKSNIKISFRIYNVNNKIIKLQERNALSYKVSAIIATIGLIFILSTQVGLLRISQDSTKIPTPKDTLFDLKLQLDEEFLIKNKVVNIDSLQKDREKSEVKDYNLKTNIGFDSLKKLKHIYSEDSSDKNYIKVLNQALNLSMLKYPLQNDYNRIKLDSYKITDSLLINNSLDTSESYKINDSTKIKYSYNILKKSKDNAISYSLIFLQLIPTGFLLYIAYNIFNYLSIRRLTKRIKIKEE